jgi:hypothetical protein
MTQLRPDTHSHLGWRPTTGFGFVRKMAVVPLAAAEIARVAQALPVLFYKVGARWQAVAVMGPVKGINVHVSREGSWRTSFVPALLRVYPFRLNGEGELGLWEGYTPEPLAAEGAQPFYKDGDLAPWLQQTVKFLKTVHTGVGTVHRSLTRLEEVGALTRWEVPGIETPKPERALTGLYAIESKRFETLEVALLQDLFRSGGLRWMHAHLDSLHHAERFKALSKNSVAPEITAPRQPDKIEQAADILAAIAADLGDAEL